MHVRLLDGDSLGYAFHLGHEAYAKSGLQVQAVDEFVQHVRYWRRTESDSVHVVVWGGRAKWRHDADPGYGSARPAGDEQSGTHAAYAQVRPWIQKALRVMPVIQVSHAGVEAADLAYAMSHELARQGQLVGLVTHDRHWLQCVRPRVNWMSPRQRERVIDEYSFRKETGFSRAVTWVECRALVGGELGLVGSPAMTQARAQELLQTWGTLASFWAAAEDPFFQAPRHLLQAALPATKERVRRNKQLLDLSAAPPVDAALATLDYGELSDIDLYEVFLDLGLKRLCAGFELFSRPLERQLSKEQASIVRRAVTNMAASTAR
jgi:5'-3' exonuclease